MSIDEETKQIFWNVSYRKYKEKCVERPVARWSGDSCLHRYVSSNEQSDVELINVVQKICL